VQRAAVGDRRIAGLANGFGDDPRTSVATVVSEADAAMYGAKDDGRDAVRIFDPVPLRGDVSGQD